MSRRRRLLVSLATAAAAATAVAPAAEAAGPASVFGGRVPCAPKDGVVACEGTTATRVATFDGVPLDVSVAVPDAAPAPRPTVVLLHGYGGRKSEFEEIARWAKRGYTVLTYTARGFNESCGTPPNRNDPVCPQKGWIRLADSRYEVRDTQHLTGVLADEGLVDPQRIGPTGPSYAGGQSLALALLKDRVMEPDGTLKPWTSPKGTPMRIAAAAPWIPWSDLVYSLLPNGRTLDYALIDFKRSLDPPGVLKRSFVSGLFALGEASGQYAPPRADPDADLRTWYSRVTSGEPYSDPLSLDILDEISSHHEAMSLPIPSGGVPPLFISNGFTDDLFPVDEALRLVNRLRAESPNTPIRQLHMDYGHQRGQNKKADTALLEQRIDQWFDHYLKGEGAAPAQEVEVLTQTCPKTAPSGGPFTAPTWGEIHPGEVRLQAKDAGTLSSAGGDETISRGADPIVVGNACAVTPARDVPQSVVFEFPAAKGDGYTVLGSPTVVADLEVSGAHAQVASRLWDVAPDGNQTLVARGLYRPDASGRQVFQLHPGAYRIANGHVAKLELLGRDEPYARASNGAFEVAVSNADVRLPVADGPGAAEGQVGSPAAPVLPAGLRIAPGSSPPGMPPAKTLPPPPAASGGSPRGVSVRTRYRKRSRGRCGGVVLRVRGDGVRGARRVEARVRGRRVARDRRAPFVLRIKGLRARRASKVAVRIVREDGSRRIITRRLRRCR